MLKKPLLAETIESNEDLHKLKYPVLVSPKLDGVRCLLDAEGKPYSRKGERFANQYLYELFKLANLPEGLDGEIGLGNPTDKDFFTRSSGWLRRDFDDQPSHKPTFYVFDKIGTESYKSRLQWLEAYCAVCDFGQLEIKTLDQYLCNNFMEVMHYEQRFVNEGYEGIMIRADIDKVGYKHGRSTWNSQELLKFKRFEDTEGVIIGFEQAESNTNEATKDEFGRTKRSSAKAGKVKVNRMGKFLVKCDRFPNIVVKIGTGEGLSHKLREEIWLNQEKYLGRVITFQYQGGSDYDGPRFPSFKGFRLEEDMPTPDE